jgi:hypothetical protein
MEATDSDNCLETSRGAQEYNQTRLIVSVSMTLRISESDRAMNAYTYCRRGSFKPRRFIFL